MSDLRTQINALVKAVQDEQPRDSLVYNLAFAISHTLSDAELEIPDETPPARHFDTVLMMQYIGAVTLLGMVAEKLPKGSEFNYGVDKAMRDANNLLLVSGSTIVFAKTSRGGFGPFEREQFKSIQKMIQTVVIERLEAHENDFLTEDDLNELSGLYRGQLMFGQATKYGEHGHPLWSKADLLARWRKSLK